MRNNTNSLLAFGTQFDQIKGYDKLIKTFSEIVKKDASFSLTIAAQIPKNNYNNKYLDYCNKLILKHGLTKHCYLKKLTFNSKELKYQSNTIDLLPIYSNAAFFILGIDLWISPEIIT